jgi:sec-independent protein translocase protein TatA
MAGLSVWHMVILLVIVVLLFGAGKLPKVMGDVAKGIKTFKAGMKDEEKEEEERAAARSAETKVLRSEDAAVHKDKSVTG